jgi:protein SCO1/2
VVSLRARREVIPAPPDFGALPSFALTDHHGDPVGTAQLAGAPLVADFIFTRCAGTCPAMTLRMAELDRRLPPPVNLLSVTVDPAHDDPPTLAAYAERFDASSRWRFATGPREEILALARDGFRLAVDPDPPAGMASAEEPILHSTRFALVDGAGHIRGYYDAFDAQAIRRLEKDLAAVLREVGR